MPHEQEWLFTVCLFALMGAVAFSTYRSGQVLRTWVPSANPLLSLPDNIIRIVLVGMCIFLGAVLGPGPSALGWQISRLPRDALAGLAAGLVLAVGLNAGGQLAVRRWGPDVMPTRMLQCILPEGRREWAGVLLAFIPAAALEELLFRSLPLAGLGGPVSPWLFLWPLSLFFGLLHWPQGGWGVAGASIAAVFLSFLFLVSHSIWLPLAAHYTLNVHQLLVAQRSGLKPLRGRRAVTP